MNSEQAIGAGNILAACFAIVAALVTIHSTRSQSRAKLAKMRAVTFSMGWAAVACFSGSVVSWLAFGALFPAASIGILGWGLAVIAFVLSPEPLSRSNVAMFAMMNFAVSLFLGLMVVAELLGLFKAVTRALGG